MKTEYSVEEVQAMAAEISDYGGTQAGLMLTAYADLLERIKADEGAVTDAVIRRAAIAYHTSDAMMRGWQPDSRDLRRMREALLAIWPKTPTQAAQAFALPKSFVDRATSSDESEPQVMGAGHLVQFTTAQVDWLMTFNARLIVNGLHPEDARMWMRATDQWDFDADPVAEADSTWQDFLANPDDDGPFDPTPAAEPVMRGETK